MLYKFRYIIWGFFIFLFVFSFSLLLMTFSAKDDPINYGSDKQDINGVFTRFQGKIYAMVPSNGYYEVEGANPNTFQSFTDSFNDAHIGFDDRYVYAGNIILEGLNPKKLKVLANNYYTDGETTYYCARNSESNDNLSAVGFVIQLMGQSLGWANKPQNYWYPFVALPKNQQYVSKTGIYIGANAHQAFFKGLEMPEANPETIRPLKRRYADREERESSSYFTDGRHVYYENQLLPLAYNNTLCEVGIEGDVPSRTAYLIDEQKGMVYADGHSFDPSGAPYKMLSTDLKHANQALFSNRESIYFYDPESEEVEKTGNNPFVDNQFRLLSPDVFASGDKVYFLSASEHWGRKRGLRSRSTHLIELEGVSASGFKKLDNGENRYTNVWQSGNRYFYLDYYGSSNFMSSAVYELKDATTAQAILSKPDWRYEDVEKLRDSEALTVPKSNTLVTSKVSYNDDWYKSYWLIFGALGLVYLISFLFRNYKMAPFIIRDGCLILNNISFKKYKIEDIDKVIFRSVVTNSKVGGYSGRMQILQKNGKPSRNSIFSTRFTLTSESDLQVISYIRELQQQLKEAGIESELVL